MIDEEFLSPYLWIVCGMCVCVRCDGVRRRNGGDGATISVGGDPILVASSAVFLIRSLSTTTTAANNQHPKKKIKNKNLYRLRNCKLVVRYHQHQCRSLYKYLSPTPDRILYIYIVYTLEFDVLHYMIHFPRSNWKEKKKVKTGIAEFASLLNSPIRNWRAHFFNFNFSKTFFTGTFFFFFICCV